MGTPVIDRVTDSAATEKAFRSGQAGFKAGQKVAVRPVEGGDLQVVDASEVGGRLDSGWALATESEKDAQIQRKKFGESAALEVAAPVIGAARSLSLGGLDVAARVIGGDEAADTLRGIAEENPIGTAIGEIGTDVGVALATGGAGLLRTGGKAALKGAGKAALKEGAEAAGRGAVARAVGRTPLGLATRAGVTAEQLAAQVTKSKAKQLAASAAVEASLVGAGQGLSKAALDTSHELTAERALAGMARGGAEGLVIGGVLGGALGGAISGGGRLAGSAARRGKQVAASLRKRAGREVAEGAAKVADDAPISVRVSPEGPPDTRSATQRFQDGLVARRTLDDDLGSGAVDFAAAEDKARRAMDKITRDEGSIAVKRRRVRKAFQESPPDNPDAIAASLERPMIEMREELSTLLARDADVLAEVGGIGKVKKVLDRIDGAMARVDEAGTEAVGDAFMALDDIKRSFGKIASGRNPRLQPIFADFYARTQGLLEDRALWGSKIVDDIQAPVNAAWTEHIPHSRAFDGLLTRRDVKIRTGSQHGFGEVSRAEPSKVKGILERLNDPTRGVDREAVVGGIRSRRALADAMETAYGVDSKLVKEVRDAADVQERILSRSEKLSADVARTNAMLEDLSAVPFAGPSAEAVAGRASAIAGVISKVQSGANSTAAKVTGSVRKFLDRASGKAGGKVARATAATTSRAITGRDRDEQVAKVYKAVESYEADPVSATRRTQAAAGVTGAAPAMAAAMATRGAEVAQLLGSKLPRQEITAASLYGGKLDGPPDMSEMEKDEILAYAQAALDPMSVVEDFENGELSFESVDALRTAWPAVYEQMRDEVVEGLGELDEPPPYADRLQLGLLLDLPTDETLDPAFIARTQASASGSTEAEVAEAQKPNLSPSQRSAPDLGKQQATKAQRLAI